MKINYKFIFILLVAFCLFLTGCKVDKTFSIEGFELYDEYNQEYITKISNDTEEVTFENIFTFNDSKAKVKYYEDSSYANEYTSSSLSLELGDNYLYVRITFSDSSNQDLTLNFYRLNMYKVTFETNCSVKIKEQLVEEGTILEKPDVEMIKKGYAFKGWDYNFKDPITSDTVIKAKWVAGSYTITYDANGGEVSEEFVIVTFGEPYVLETPTREGYTFLGWKYNNRLISGNLWNIDEDATIVAEWEVETRTYEIEYIIVGAVGPNLQRTYTNKEEVVLRTPYKNGYRFDGWYFEGDLSGERVYTLPKGTEGHIILYSKWVRFKLEGAKISFLGDSISTFYDENSPVNSLYGGKNEYYYPIYSSTVTKVEYTWWYQVVQNTKTTLVANDSWSGSSCYNNGSEVNSGAMNYNRINNLAGSEIVVILIGTNDNVNGHSQINFTKAYNTMLKRIKEKCPDAFIFCCTLGYSAYKGYNYTESTRLAYNEIIKKAAVDNDCEVVDIASVQTEETYSSLLGDSLHLNRDGMVAYANKVVETIKNYVGAI